MANDKTENQGNDVSLAPLAKDGDKLMAALDSGKMTALLSGSEIMYIFIDKVYKCYIHPLASEEGRAKSFEKNEKNRAMIKNLATLAEQIFEVGFQPHMEPMGVMVAAEQGIVSFLDMTGNLPAEDLDFITGEKLS